MAKFALPHPKGAVQRIALAELETGGFAPAAADPAKEMLRWIRQAASARAARWRCTRIINYIGGGFDPGSLLDPVCRALPTFATHIERIIERWNSVTPMPASKV
jgi:hypothetical protein